MLTNGNDKYRYENFKKKQNGSTLIHFFLFQTYSPSFISPLEGIAIV